MTEDWTGHAAKENIRDPLDTLLGSMHEQLGIAVHDRLMARGGVPELRDPDLALDRLLASAHRAAGHAVTARLTHGSRVEPAGNAGEAVPPVVSEALASRPAAVRLKYRRHALRLAREYWPRDLVEAMQTAVCLLEELSRVLEMPQQPVVQSRKVVEQLDALFEEVLLLPAPRRHPAPLIAADYVAAVEIRLAGPAEQLYRDVARARHVLEEEFEPLLATDNDAAAACLPGAEVAAEDLHHDVEHASLRAAALSRAVAEVERISSDFIGADLHDANLDEVLLEGIRWDASTVWPDGWEALIRQVSVPVGEGSGVLVVAAEPDDSAVSAEV
ncbi:hypothetical protein [Streptomyces malaysiensis]|uniref:hypothetical protein n=1 Tax=Streptomyces malaysiensis TaxID=92644 RepID=UPI0009A090B3|nr:hypothetical protein [Streptomyces sp. SPMA113]